MKNLGEAREVKKLESFGPIITNSLIITLALFDDIPPNCFNRKGQEFKDLSQEERTELKSILQKII